MTRWFIVFLGWMVIEYVWTRLTIHIVKANYNAAGLYSAVITGLSTLTVGWAANDLSLVLAAALGAGIGTYLTVRFVK